MTNQWIDAFIRLFTTLGFIAGGVVAIAKYLKYLEVKASEKSVGATKIRELEAAIQKVEADLEDVQSEDAEQKRAIEELKIDLKDLMHRISDAFFGKR